MASRKIELGHIPLKKAIEIAEKIQECGAILDLQIMEKTTTARITFDDTNLEEFSCLHKMGVLEPEDEEEFEAMKAHAR